LMSYAHAAAFSPQISRHAEPKMRLGKILAGEIYGCVTEIINLW